MRKPTLVVAAVFLSGCGTDVSGPAPSLFSCLLAEPALLEAGEVRQVSGAGNRGLCVGGGDGVEFVYIPFHAADADEDSVELEVEVTGAGFDDVTGPPSPAPPAPSLIALRDAAPAPVARGADPLHGWLRAWERTEGNRRLRASPDAFHSVDPVVADVPAVGDPVSYNVAISCTAQDYRGGRVMYVSDRAVVVADTANPPGLLPTDFEHFGETFDTLVDPVVVAHFGSPTDIDDNQRVIIFFTRAVNELTGPDEDVFTAGFFWSGDLFPEEETARAQACPEANQAEMFYMLTADPTGVAGPDFSVDFVRDIAIGVIAHEYQHLINAARRLWVNEAVEFEEVWLNEGLSHLTEELIFYAASGLAPGLNLGYDELVEVPRRADAFNRYMAGNASNYSRYLSNPDTASLMGVDALPTRGASWSFLRYAADRTGAGDQAFLREVVNARVAGLENLRDVLGEDPLAWMQDWTVSVYADDAVPVDAIYTQPSWDFRELFPNTSLGRFPLRVLPLEPGTTRVLELQPGGAAFPRFGLGPDGRAVLHVDESGDVPPAALRGSLLRTK